MSAAAVASVLPAAQRGPTVVALSGGVDSAVAAHLLRESGHDVVAVFMKNWEEDDRDGRCAAEADLRDAELVCEHLGIALRTVNLSSDYWERVFEPMLEALRAGLTPNPDVTCNRAVKFDAFVEFTGLLGARRVATGHYARIDERGGRLRLLKGADASKDQSYFLHALDQGALERAVFPVGGLCKEEVRRTARRIGLAVHDKKDSTGICFVGERPFAQFLMRYIAPCPGPVESVDGEVLGQHAGLAFYTIGQRRGLGIGGRRGRAGAPWYVVDKDLARNALVVAQGRDHPRLHRRRLVAGPMHWIAGTPPARAFRCRAKIRYRQAERACEAREMRDGRWEITFDESQWAVTPGQSAVLYRGDECLGGGIIDSFTDPESR